MDALIDLSVIEPRLSNKNRQAKGLIRQLIGSFAVRNDIAEARRALDISAKWFNDEVAPRRINGGDTGDEAVIGQAVFSWAILRLCRALDMASEGRAKIDLRPAIKSAGFEESLNELLHFRNKELAHFGGYQVTKGIFTNERSILRVLPSGESYIGLVWFRWRSEISLSEHAYSVISCSAVAAENYGKDKQAKLLELLEGDASLREEFIACLPEASFDKAAFFQGSVHPEIPPDGPVVWISW